MSEALSERLRPKVFTDLIQPTQVINILSKMSEQKTPVNMLIYGSPGGGKTSAVRILRNALGDDCVEFNGSRDTRR
jgi:replication-associated recombination protein RarA